MHRLIETTQHKSVPELGAVDEQRRLQLLEPQAVDERAVRRAQVDQVHAHAVFVVHERGMQSANK